MEFEFTERTVIVPLSSTFIEVLLQLHDALDPALASSLRASLAGELGRQSSIEFALSKKRPKLPSKKYVADFLGVQLEASTLPEMFAIIIDLMADFAPEALAKLAVLSTPKRRFVARKKEMIHLANSLLPTMQTASGWWISKNISQEDLKRGLRALSEVAGLTFGQDVVFPAVRHV